MKARISYKKIVEESQQYLIQIIMGNFVIFGESFTRPNRRPACGNGQGGLAPVLLEAAMKYW
jgi:hypothetical protein